MLKEISAYILSHDLSPGSSVPLHSLPGTDKEQRIYERQKTAHRNPPVKRSLTGTVIKVNITVAIVYNSTICFLYNLRD